MSTNKRAYNILALNEILNNNCNRYNFKRLISGFTFWILRNRCVKISEENVLLNFHTCVLQLKIVT